MVRVNSTTASDPIRVNFTAFMKIPLLCAQLRDFHRLLILQFAQNFDGPENHPEILRFHVPIERASLLPALQPEETVGAVDLFIDLLIEAALGPHSSLHHLAHLEKLRPFIRFDPYAKLQSDHLLASPVHSGTNLMLS
jgi:hypothetical protein